MDFEITKTLNLTPSSIYNLEIIERTPTLLKLKAKGPSAFSSFSGLVVSIIYILVVLIMLIYTPTLSTLTILGFSLLFGAGVFSSTIKKEIKHHLCF
jgi:hypothetical protein